jgi:phosphoribosylamine--glycine ligase
LLLAAARGRLLDAARPLRLDGRRVPALPIATVAIVLAAAGYPGKPRGGDPISGLAAVRDAPVLVFHGGTTADGAGGYDTDGGRVVTVVGRGRDLEAARGQAEAAADLIGFDGLQRRHDIGIDHVPIASGR